MKQHILKLSVLGTLPFMAMACGDGKNSVSETSSLVYKGSRWANPSAIAVCWENGAQVGSDIKDDLKAKLIAEYHNKTAIRFTRFDNCTSADLTATLIRVHFNLVHDWANTSGIAAGGGLSWVGPVAGSLGGTSGNGTMRIDIGRSGTYPAITHGLRQFAIDQTRGTAVHEFGHALGLAHEQDRTDAPNCNDQQRIVNGGDWVYVGAYDPSSIMNYCKQDNLNSLTTGDVGGINFLYPQTTQTPTPTPTTPTPTPTPTPEGTFYLKAQHSGKCVDITSSSTLDGANVQQYTCNQTRAQRFRLVTAAKNTFLLQNVNSGKCIDLATASRVDGTGLVQRTCSGSKTQRIMLRPTAGGQNLIQFTSSGKCMDVSGASLADEAKIHQWSCAADAPNQSFLQVK